MRAIVLIASAAALSSACDRSSRAQPATTGSTSVATVESTPIEPKPRDLAAERLPSETAHPRILLDPDTLARIRKAAETGTPAWKRVDIECKRYSKNIIGGGYQAFQWTEAIANLSLCWHATGEEFFARRALVYVEALLDDRHDVGDGKGGDAMVQSDSGYAIRSYAVYAALAYDWLHDAPGMTPELRQKIIDRLRVWIPWYGENGYLADNPFANYFWGYHTAITFAALATYGDNPDAPAWLETARDELLTELCIPAFSTKLRGGEWAEGWQYGQLVATELAMIVRAYRTATGADLGPMFPWFSELVDHQLHSLLPGGEVVYDNGTRHERPPKPSSQALTAALLVLDHTAPERAAEARFLARRLYPRHPRQRVWVSLLAERPGAPQRDPRQRGGLSYHLPGPGLTFARSSWKPDAVWASLQAGPKIATDHQHNDQGHFALWRGADPLLIDGGGPFGYATINHNSLLIDDRDEVLNYTPNQGVWARKSRTLRYGDDGTAVVAVGDIGDAWAPKCVERGCDRRAVREAIRTFVYVRPDLLVLDDRVVVDKPDYGVTWAAHIRREPKAGGNLVSGVVGGSRVDIRTLTEVESVGAVKEPTSDSDHVYRQNVTDGDMWRIELESPRGQRERAFLNWIVAGPADARPPAATPVEGEGLRGARGDAGDRTVAVLFATDPAGGRIELPASGDDLVVVTGLTPDTRYRLSAKRKKSACVLTVERAADGRDSGSGGLLSARAERCEVE